MTSNGACEVAVVTMTCNRCLVDMTSSRRSVDIINYMYKSVVLDSASKPAVIVHSLLPSASMQYRTKCKNPKRSQKGKGIRVCRETLRELVKLMREHERTALDVTGGVEENLQ